MSAQVGPSLSGGDSQGLDLFFVTLKHFLLCRFLRLVDGRCVGKCYDKSNDICDGTSNDRAIVITLFASCGIRFKGAACCAPF